MSAVLETEQVKEIGDNSGRRCFLKPMVRKGFS